MIVGSAVMYCSGYSSGVGKPTYPKKLSDSSIYRFVAEGESSTGKHITIVEDGAKNVYLVWTIPQPPSKYVRINKMGNDFESVDQPSPPTAEAPVSTP